MLGEPLLQNAKIHRTEGGNIAIVGYVDDLLVSLIQYPDGSWACSVKDVDTDQEAKRNHLLLGKTVELTLTAFRTQYGVKVRPYTDNQHHWPIGALVIHRADAKNEKMLMKVVEYTKQGRVKTVYCQEENKKVWENYSADLLDPAVFGIEVNS